MKPGKMDHNDIVLHETIDVIDSSKVETMQECWRKLFFIHILGWKLEGENVHLLFGRAWHAGLAHLYNNRLRSDSILEAVDIATSIIREFYPPSEDAAFKKKQPAILPIAFAEYVGFARNHMDHEKEVIFTEGQGAVRVLNNRIIYVKMDLVQRNPFIGNKIEMVEHKTGSAMSKNIIQGLSVKPQVPNYTHALYSIFDPDEFDSLLINLTVFRANDRVSDRFPIKFEPENLGDWLVEQDHYLNMYEYYLNDLNETSPEDKIMSAFPRNRTACMHYGLCPYFNICHNWPNPVKFSGVPPIGFVKEYWDPRIRDAEYEFIQGDDGKAVMKKIEKKEKPNGRPVERDAPPKNKVRSGNTDSELLL